jgi:CHASE3 domain sensor protein
MLKLKERLPFMTGPNSAVALLIAVATGAVLFTVLAGALVYANTRNLISSDEWVRHTQEVLASLQRVSLLIERMEYRSRLYSLTGNEEQLTRARASANQLDTTLVHLRALVTDSSFQLTNLQSLTSCSQELIKSVNSFSLKSELSSSQLQQC